MPCLTALNEAEKGNTVLFASFKGLAIEFQLMA